MTEDNFKVLLLTEGREGSKGELCFMFYGCEMTAKVWGESGKEQRVRTESLWCESGCSHSQVVVNFAIFQKFLHVYTLDSGNMLGPEIL